MAVLRDVTCYISAGWLPSARERAPLGVRRKASGTGKGVLKRSLTRLRSRGAMASFLTGARLDAAALHWIRLRNACGSAAAAAGFGREHLDNISKNR